MRTWSRAVQATTCGYCDLPIYQGQPLLTIRLDGVKWPRLRCVECAGPAPADLPMAPLPTPRNQPVPTSALTRPTRAEWVPYRDD